MFYLTYRGKPNKNYFNQSIEGGYIGCWIETTSVENADNIARKLIAEQNWDILDFEEFQTIDPDTIDANSEHISYYEQALIDKEVLVFYTYPKKEE